MSATAVGAAGVGGGDRCRALWFGTEAPAVRFAVRTIFSTIGVRMKKGFGFNETQFGSLVGAPTTSLHGWYFRFGRSMPQAAAGPRGPFRQVDSRGPQHPAPGAGTDRVEVPA